MAIPKRRYPVQQPARQARVIVVHSRGLQETRSRLQIEVQALHASKIRKSIEECKLIGEVINTKVINFNLHDLKRRRSFDLHWMTTEGAVQFVKTIMEGIKDSEPIELITGRGVHSKNNEPRIKKALEAFYAKQKEDFSIRQQQGNSGILMLRKLGF